MATVNIDFHELSVFQAHLGEISEQAKIRSQVAVKKTTLDIQRVAQIKVAVDTGFLRGSIGSDFSDSGLSAEIGPTADYGIWVELGTSVMPAQPYLTPAFDQKIGQLDRAAAQIAEMT